MTSSGLEIEEMKTETIPKGMLLMALRVSNRNTKNLARLRLRYDIPPSIIMRVPVANERVVCPEGKEIAFFEDVLHARERFPFTRDM